MIYNEHKLAHPAHIPGFTKAIEELSYELSKTLVTFPLGLM